MRFYATNAAGSRVFNLAFSGDVGLHLLGGDNGLFRTPLINETGLIAPSERLIFQAWLHDHFGEWDTLELLHRTPKRDFVLARLVFEEDTAAGNLAGSLSEAENAAVAAELAPYHALANRPPDREISLGVEWVKPPAAASAAAASAAAAAAKVAAAADLDADALGVEWEDLMGPLNSESTPANTRWIIRDLKTGLENHRIDWTFKRGEPALIRIRNALAGPHPMPHPIHFHGQRFLVVRENGKPPPLDMGWKDTYLVGRGYTVDILLDPSNPGRWMFHCHIPEHMESDMMAHFTVE